MIEINAPINSHLNSLVYIDSDINNHDSYYMNLYRYEIVGSDSFGLVYMSLA